MRFIRNIRQNLKDPKKKSLTLLGIYAVFFIIIFIIIRFGETVDYSEDYSTINNEEESINEVFNYKYIYKIDENDNVTEVEGTLKDGIDLFTYNDFEYKKENNIVYLNDEEVQLDFDIDKYKYNNIELLIENSDSETKYKDSNKIVYNINILKYFESLNEENNCNQIDCTNINIPITIEKEDIIKDVLIDLSSYYGHKYNIQIQYDILSDSD